MRPSPGVIHGRDRRERNGSHVSDENIIPDNRNERTREFCDRIDRGLIPAVPVPFDSAGRVDEAAQEQYIGYMSEQPIAGVAVWVHTGRGLFLTADERRRVLRAWRAGLPPHFTIVAGAGAPAAAAADPRSYARIALEMAGDAAESGADALLVHPPRVPDIAAHHVRLAGAGLPLMLFYLYEAAGGVSYSDGLLQDLLAMPSVCGIKVATLDSVMRYQDISRLLDNCPGRLLVTGEDRFFGYSFMHGANAALVGLGAACSTLLAGLMRAWFEQRGNDFVRLSALVDELAEVTFIAPMEGYIQRMLLVLARQGVISASATFDPWGPSLDREVENARIRAALPL